MCLTTRSQLNKQNNPFSLQREKNKNPHIVCLPIEITKRQTVKDYLDSTCNTTYDLSYYYLEKFCLRTFNKYFHRLNSLVRKRPLFARSTLNWFLIELIQTKIGSKVALDQYFLYCLRIVYRKIYKKNTFQKPFP